MRKMDLKNRWVIVTGASSGLGKAMATLLAKEYGANLILVARRAEKLAELKQALIEQFKIEVDVVPADLSTLEGVDDFFSRSTSNREIYAVILNAGITYFGRHLDMSWQEFQTLLNTNVTGIVRSVNQFVPYLLEQNNGGGILLVSSVGGVLPVPYQAAYSGSKAFITNFGMAFNEELKRENISITVFSPGGIATEMNDSSGLSAQFEGSAVLQSPEDCAADGVQAMVSRRSLFVPGSINKLQLFGARLLPRKVLTFFAGNLYEKALNKKNAAASSN